MSSLGPEKMSPVRLKLTLRSWFLRGDLASQIELFPGVLCRLDYGRLGLIVKSIAEVVLLGLGE